MTVNKCQCHDVPHDTAACCDWLRLAAADWFTTGFELAGLAQCAAGLNIHAGDIEDWREL